MKYLIVIIVAALPIFVWAYIFYKIRPAKKEMLIMAFLSGCVSPFIILVYSYFWGTTINLIFFKIQPQDYYLVFTGLGAGNLWQTLMVFVFGVGMAEEFVKHFVIRQDKPEGLVLVFILFLIGGSVWLFFSLFTTFKFIYLAYLLLSWLFFYMFMVAHKYLKYESIDQVILVSIMAALGFAFVENIICFFRAESFEFGILLLILRSIFVVIIHIFCSGIFGYYYGLSLFAGPYLREYEMRKRKMVVIDFLKKIFWFSKKNVFAKEKLLEGLVLAMLFHGIFDFIMDIKLNLHHVLDLLGIENHVDVPLFGVFMILYFIAGIWFLYTLLMEKENHLKFGLVGTKMMPEEDYVDLIYKFKNLADEKDLEARLLKKNWGTPEELKAVRKQVQYLKKYKLLEEKYLNTKWMSVQDLHKFKQQVQDIKDLK